MWTRQPFASALIGVAVAVAGLLVDLVALPIARFGSPLFTYVADRSPSDQGLLLSVLAVWVVAAAVALVAAVAKSRSRSDGKLAWGWVLFGFGLPSLVTVAVSFVIGLVTYSTGVIPDDAEGLWGIASRATSYAAVLALLGSLIAAIRNRRARPGPGTSKPVT